VIAIVVAADKNGAIGAYNQIPWHIKSDLVRLANLTRQHTVIVGRKSFDSMINYYKDRTMPGAHYIVVTRNAGYKPASTKASTALSMPEAIKKAKSLGDDQIMIIGGGAIFNESMPYVERIYYTEVQTKLQGDVDAYFPKPPAAKWRAVAQEHHDQDDRDQYATDTTIFERA
jgi:dihydrofolate reductase